MMLIGLPSGAFHNVSSGTQEIIQAIRKISELGFPLVELSTDVEVYYPRRLRLVAMNVDLSMKYTAHMPFITPSIGSPAKEMREMTERIFQRVIESLRPFDPIHYVIHPLGIGEEKGIVMGLDLEGLEDRVVEMHEIIGDYVGVHHRVLIENTEYIPLERREKYLEDYGFYGCLDVGHVVLQGKDPIEVLERVGRYVKEIHLHDVVLSRRPHGEIKIDHMPPGVGIVSVGEILEYAKRLKIPVVILEVYNPKYAFLAAERAKKLGIL